MKSTYEIREYQGELRERIPKEQSETKKELLRERIFALDEVLGLFDTGKTKTQFELFAMLQTVQGKKIAHIEHPTTHDEISAVAALQAYKWVMGSN